MPDRAGRFATGVVQCGLHRPAVLKANTASVDSFDHQPDQLHELICALLFAEDMCIRLRCNIVVAAHDNERHVGSNAAHMTTQRVFPGAAEFGVQQYRIHCLGHKNRQGFQNVIGDDYSESGFLKGSTPSLASSTSSRDK